MFASITANAKTLKLATWNLEWLVSKEDIKRYNIPNDVLIRSNSDFKLLRQYAMSLSADIIALQEVGSLDTLYSIFPKNLYDFFITQGSIAQHVVIVIRKNTTEHIIKNQELTELNIPNHGHHPLRNGLDITLTINHQKIRLLAIHLKSGCADYPLDRKNLKKSCLLLKNQHIILQQWISQRIKENQDFIIFGDFNHVLSPNDPFFSQLSFPNATLTIPTEYQANPCWDRNYFIDGFLLSQNIAKQITHSSLRVMTYKKQNNDKRYRLSDHCPVSIQLSFPDNPNNRN